MYKFSLIMLLRREEGVGTLLNGPDCFRTKLLSVVMYHHRQEHMSGMAAKELATTVYIVLPSKSKVLVPKLPNMEISFPI